MATTTKKRTPASKGGSHGVDVKAVEDAIKRLNQSIEAAEAAGKDLRSGVAKGSRDLVRDLERTLKNARTNARRVGKAISKDLQKAIDGEAGTGRRNGSASRGKSK